MSKKTHKYERIALACQGGGSLGAYHIGAYKAMAEHGYFPDVVSGISIGAFTAALIAGNEPNERVAKLEEFWDTISWPAMPEIPNATPEMKKFQNLMSSMTGFIFGQPNFFEPRIPGPSLQQKGTIAATSYYDTAKLKETLLKFVDFDRINHNKTQLILGATRVKNGELVFFDSQKQKILPEHVMASGSMPPGFPGIRIEGDLFWDGGCVSNTPLEGIYTLEPKVDTLCFMIDLFCPKGKEPENMDDVELRAKDILYTSRTSHHIEHVAHKHNLSKALAHLLKEIPKNLKDDVFIKHISDFIHDIKFDIVHIVYDGAVLSEIKSKDCEFSKASIVHRSEHGYSDLQEALKQSPWIGERPKHMGTHVHKFHKKRSL